LRRLGARASRGNGELTVGGEKRASLGRCQAARDAAAGDVQQFAPGRAELARIQPREPVGARRHHCRSAWAERGRAHRPRAATENGDLLPVRDQPDAGSVVVARSHHQCAVGVERRAGHTVAARSRHAVAGRSPWPRGARCGPR